MTVASCGAAHADEFSTLAPGDPAYAGLATLSRDSTDLPQSHSGASNPLTRYEAALETARAYVAITGQQRSGAPLLLTRERAHALRQLVIELRPELRELAVDTDAALALADSAIHGSLSEGTTEPATLLNSASSLGTGGLARPAAASGTTFSNELLTDQGAGDGGEQREVSETELSSRLRVGTALLALQREASDPFANSGGAGLHMSESDQTGTLGGAATVAYDVNPWLSMHLASSERDLTADRSAPASPFAAPIFASTTRADAAGGGVDVALGGVHLTTDIESLAGTAGVLGTSVGGGVGLNAWQNRLTLSAHMARLQPADSAVLASTATELHVGFDVTQRLNLSLLYQGLFTDQTPVSSSRVAGGINLSF